jgi:hypothetical protein
MACQVELAYSYCKMPFICCLITTANCCCYGLHCCCPGALHDAATGATAWAQPSVARPCTGSLLSTSQLQSRCLLFVEGGEWQGQTAVWVRDPTHTWPSQVQRFLQKAGVGICSIERTDGLAVLEKGAGPVWHVHACICLRRRLMLSPPCYCCASRGGKCCRSQLLQVHGSLVPGHTPQQCSCNPRTCCRRLEGSTPEGACCLEGLTLLDLCLVP